MQRHAGFVEMCPPIDERQLSEQLCFRDLRHDHDVELPVVDARPGRHLHAAAEVATVRGGSKRHGTLVHAFAVHQDPDGLAFVLHDRADRSDQERERPPEELGGAVDQLVRERADAEARNVHEARLAGFPLMTQKAHAAGVDGLGDALRDAREARLDLAGRAEGAQEVATGAERQHADLHPFRALGLDQARGHLGERAIASGH